jgi:hypothetical protein
MVVTVVDGHEDAANGGRKFLQNEASRCEMPAGLLTEPAKRYT